MKVRIIDENHLMTKVSRYDNIGIEKYASKVLIGYIKSSKLSQQFLENLVRFATSLLLFIQDKA